jgi:hypothetical protein
MGDDNNPSRSARADFFRAKGAAMSNVKNASTDRFPAPKSSRRGWRWGIFLLGAVGLSIVAYVSIQIFGRVYGEEFSPNTFQRRNFFYYELPLLQIQITPIYRDECTNPLEQHLLRETLIGSEASSELRWDLVWAQQGARSMDFGDANILCDYLDARDGNNRLRWRDWTDENPELAKVLWATVDRLAAEQLYLLIPDVFVLADRATDAPELEETIAETLGDRYELLARTQIELGNTLAAVRLAKQGLFYAPNRLSLRELADERQD